MNWSGSIVAVTGGSGFIGRHLVRALSPLCKTVKNLDLVDFTFDLGNVRFYKTNMSSESDVTDGIKGAEIVFHLSSKSFPESIQNPREDFLAGPLGTFNVLDAARKCGVKKVIFASSFLVYGHSNSLPVSEDQVCEPISPYGASKLASEIYCETFSKVYNLSTVSLRFANVYGPSQRGPYLIPNVIQKIYAGEDIHVFGTGKQTRDFIFVSDVARALILASESKINGESLNISSGKETSILDVIGAISKASGLKPELVFNPPRTGDVERFFLSNSNAQKQIHFTPKIDLREGIRQTWVEWTLANHERIPDEVKYR